MDNILCFGDSNTFGFVPLAGTRYAADERWSGILKKYFENRYNVIEAGCNNRTCIADNPEGLLFTGYKAISPYLENHKNFALVIIALGINDLQFAYNLSACDVSEGLKAVVLDVKQKTKSKTLIVIPNKIGDDVLNSYFSQMFDRTSIEKSTRLSSLFKSVAGETDSFFLDLNEIVVPSFLDGLHYEKEEHQKIAKAVIEKIQKIVD